MNETRPLCTLIGALGGQGGGVLVEWLVEAARHAGFPAQATSIPGVAQRTGATTYYLEVFPEKNPEAEPVFCLYPSAGDVDLVAALEPVEAGRALANGFVTKRTTVITARERVYGIGEKSVAGDGLLDPRSVLDALTANARAVVHFDAGRLAREAGSQANAVLFGAIAGSRVLPLADEDCRRAICEVGVAAEANLAGFAAGLELALRGAAEEPATPRVAFDPPPAGFDEALAAFPEAVRPLVGHALARLVDYQGRRYARRYLARLQRIVGVDRKADGGSSGFRLTAEVAKRLGAWMSYEDVIRVAQLKTRPGRLARIRSELQARPGEPVRVVDFLRPGGEELRDLLPRGLSPLVPPARPGRPRGGIALRVPTGTPLGFLLFRALAVLRPLRPLTSRYVGEQRMIDAWLDSVVAAARRDYELARRTAEAAVWIRGYGDVRSRGKARLEGLLRNWTERLAADPQALARTVAESLDDARHRPDADAVAARGGGR